jgi:hypothetical protein
MKGRDFIAALRGAAGWPLERDDFSLNRHPALSFCWGMIFPVAPTSPLSPYGFFSVSAWAVCADVKPRSRKLSRHGQAPGDHPSRDAGN